MRGTRYCHSTDTGVHQSQLLCLLCLDAGLMVNILAVIVQ